jgi:hypothetical protein
MTGRMLRPSQYKIWPVGPGPFVGLRLDAEGFALIEHVRMTGRLPGRGACECWDNHAGCAIDYGEDELHHAVTSIARHAVARAARADRSRAAYLTDFAIARLEQIEHKNREAAAEAQRKWQARQQQHEQDALKQKRALAEERKRWQGEKRRFRLAPQERRERWQAEQAEWSKWENGESRRSEVKATRKERIHLAASLEEIRKAERKAALEAQRQRDAEHVEEQQQSRQQRHDERVAARRKFHQHSDSLVEQHFNRRAAADLPDSALTSGVGGAPWTAQSLKASIDYLANQPNSAWSFDQMRLALTAPPDLFNYCCQQLVREGRIRLAQKEPA